MVFVIAEIGVNHNGEFETAEFLVRAAAKSGANAVKFQTYKAEEVEPPGPRRDLLKKLELPREWHHELRDIAHGLGLEFISTPFDVDSLWFLVCEVGVKTIKISSGEIENQGLLRAAKNSKCKIILSTGMATMLDIKKAVDVVRGATLLHCVSGYPAGIEEVNLSAMVAMGEILNAPVGLSDHTKSTMVPAIAVAMGAVVVEKHITLDNLDYGPDHAASLNVSEFAQMVRNIRDAELAIGSPDKKIQPSELKTISLMNDRRRWRDERAVG